MTATQAELQFTWTPVGTAGADDSITFDDVQLEANLSTSTWTPTAYDRLKFEAEYNFCKRHYKKTQPYNVAPAQNSGLLGALVYSSSAISKIGVQWNFDIDSRVVGTVTTFNPQAANANWQNITVPAAIVATIDTASASNSTKFIYIGGATIGAGDNQALIHCQVDSGI